jgi:hypothetical protein
MSSGQFLKQNRGETIDVVRGGRWPGPVAGVPSDGAVERQPHPRRLRCDLRLAAATRFYAALLYLTYDADTIKDADGNVVRLSPTTPGSIRIAAAAPMAWYVSTAKFLGADVGALVALPIANASLEAPAFGFGQAVDTSVSDLLVRPLDLGWHTRRADVAAGLQL